MSNEVVVAIDVGGTSIKGAVADRSGAVLHRVRTPTPQHDPDRAIEQILGLAAQLTGWAQDHGCTARGVGVVVPGQVDADRGIAVYSANIGWRDVPLGELLSQRTGLPAALGHDVTAGGLAQLRFGGHGEQEVANSVVLQLGTGVAGLLVCDGRPIHGAGGLSGEFGHIPVFPDGEACPCGQRGCLERYASAAAIARRYTEAGGPAAGVSARRIAELRPDDPIAARVWDEAARALALGIATVTMLLDPALIILTGGLSAAGDQLLEPVRRELSTAVVWRSAPTVVVSELGPDVGVAGAALFGWQAAGAQPPQCWLG